MGKWRTERLEMNISFTTNGERVGRITGSSHGYGGKNTLELPDDDEVLMAYLEQFHGLRLSPINKSGLVKAIQNTVNDYLEEK